MSTKHPMSTKHTAGMSLFQAFWLGVNVARGEIDKPPALFGDARLLGEHAHENAQAVSQGWARSIIESNAALAKAEGREP